MLAAQAQLIVFMSNFHCEHYWRSVIVYTIVLLLGVRLQAEGEQVNQVTIRVDPQTVVSVISPDFIGFGYESSAVAQTNYFSAKNAGLIQLYRNLSPHGLIRIGGNVSDHTQYVPDGIPTVNSERAVTIITRKSLLDFGGFVRATGWKVMWGLNLGSGSKAEAVKEAVAVDAVLGSQLQSFQIGNEVEGLSRFKHSYDAYHAAYLDYKSGIRAVLPNVSFSGPDSVGNWSWITNFASTESGDIKLLTHHYYRCGAQDPTATPEKLLKHDDGWDNRLKQLQQLSKNYGIAYRINEVNSFSGGGKSGVSDTFASALWCLDYMFVLASYGCDGVNMETDINHLAWISHYSPIVHTPAGNCSARPEYYGMLAFAMAGKGDLLKLTLDKSDVNLSAYATRDEQGFLWVTVINKDMARDAQVEITLPEGYSGAAAFRLVAPSVESRDQLTFAGAKVSAKGKWTPKSPEKLAVKEGVVRLLVPHTSAVLVRLRT